MTGRWVDLPKKWLGRCPAPSNLFIALGVGLSVLVALAAQIPGLEMIHGPSEVLFFALITVFAVLLSVVWTSCYWFVYGLISIRYPSRVMMVLFGVVLLGVDAYIRITAVFFPTSSTSASAVILIPIAQGIVVLPFQWGCGVLWSSFHRGPTDR